jgi:hypothetical protein
MSKALKHKKLTEEILVLFPKSEQAQLTPLACLIKRGETEAMRNLLGSINPSQEDMDNALLICCERANKTILKELITHGANPKACKNHALIWSYFTKNYEIFEELAQYYSSQELMRALKVYIKTEPKDFPPEIKKIISKSKVSEMRSKISKSQANIIEI